MFVLNPAYCVKLCRSAMLCWDILPTFLSLSVHCMEQFSLNTLAYCKSRVYPHKHQDRTYSSSLRLGKPDQFIALEWAFQMME